jgi:membrane-anchored mycosin MYCP
MRGAGRAKTVSRRGAIELIWLLVVAVVLAVSAQPALAQTPRQMQWWLDALRIPTANALSTGRNVTVGVLDTGVDGSSPAFSGRLLPGIDLDNSAESPHADTDGHGTSMAGIIAASGTDGGPMGVAPGATVLPVRVAKDNNGNIDFTMPIAIKYAVDHGVKVINISWGGSGVAPTDMKQALEYAFQHDVVVVAAVGNLKNGSKAIDSPANYPGVVAVTGTNRSGTFWSGSVQGSAAVLSAPAEGIVATPSAQVNDGAYAISDGTSCSSAIVAGVAALVRSKYPSLNAANVINRLIKTAGDKGPAGRDPQYGFGVVDPVKALTAQVASVGQNPLVAPVDSAPATASKSASGHASVASGSGGTVALVLVGVAVVLVLVVAAMVLWWRRRAAGRAGSVGTDGGA